MKRYDVAIKVLDKKYVDQLIVSLARQGYSVYYREDDEVVGFTATDDEITDADLDFLEQFLGWKDDLRY